MEPFDVQKHYVTLRFIKGLSCVIKGLSCD